MTRQPIGLTQRPRASSRRLTAAAYWRSEPFRDITAVEDKPREAVSHPPRGKNRPSRLTVRTAAGLGPGVDHLIAQRDLRRSGPTGYVHLYAYRALSGKELTPRREATDSSAGRK